MSTEPMSVGLADVRLARSGSQAGVEVARAAVAMRSFPLHLSPGLGICVKTGDSHAVVADGHPTEYPRDSVCVRMPGCVWESGRGRHGFVSIDVMPAVLGDAVSDIACVGGSMSFAPRRAMPRLPRLFGALTRAQSSFELECLAATLVVELSDAGALSIPGGDRSGSARVRAVAVARDHLHANSHLRPSLEDAARASGTDKFTLLRDFRRELGTTPHAYLVLLRLGHAQRLLGDGHPPASVAVEVGFADQAHLGRWFRRVYGMSPASYAASVRRAISFQTDPR